MVKQSCSDKWIARSHIRRIKYVQGEEIRTEFSRCLLFHGEANSESPGTCPGVADLSDYQLSQLKSMASKGEIACSFE